MKTLQQTVGKRGEDEACRRLRELGHIILARNWRSGHLELDIVTLTKGGIHFVEVKSKTAPVTADPVLSITPSKRSKMISAAAAFMHSEERKTLYADLEIFFDVVTVVFYNDRAEVEYFPQAFVPIYV